MGHIEGALLDAIQSNEFNLMRCLEYLKLYSNNIGIHHVLVNKLSDFTYDELEFFIPQFVQLLVIFETDSMALEDFLIAYCTKFPHFCLVVFWNLQAFIFELRNDPESYSFQIVRRFINKLQSILFNPELELLKRHEFRENLMPALMLCGAIASGFGVPRMNEYILPLVKSQGKQQKSFVFKLANFQKTLTRNLTMKNTRISSEVATTSVSDEEQASDSKILYEKHQRSASVPRVSSKKNSLTLLSDDSEAYNSEVYTSDDDDMKSVNEMLSEISMILVSDASRSTRVKYTDVEDNLRINTIIKSKKSMKGNLLLAKNTKPFIEDKNRFSKGGPPYNSNSQSLPDLSKVPEEDSRPHLYPTESESSLSFPYSSIETELKRNKSQFARAPNAPSFEHLLKILQVNYAKKETKFIMALQNISVRLSQVPKQARLSALRAELSIINDTLLPSEIDVPQLLPITSNKNKRYHKILKLSINEACVLNSAERVPFLLLVEYLSDELDFNPFTEYNQKIIANKNDSQKLKESASQILDIPDSSLKSPANLDFKIEEADKMISSNLDTEADLSDFPILSQKSSNRDLNSFKVESPNREIPKEDENKRFSPIIGTAGTDTSTKALADQMRIASVMLQQLDSSGKSTSEQSIAIRNRIVESMIALQDQFDSIDYEKLNQLKGDVPDAGQRKMENDFKLGEDWNTKKQRIRNSSVYGHLKNWELCSVIAKNGDDLPQEAFACQLITMISSIWKRNQVGAWTKRMKILITSAQTGLVETITNAISIHSIKKSLTEHSISKGDNLKGRIFTLQDYFDNLFGSPDSHKYKQARDNFARSLASYSIICYVLQIKDRHNGNIMVDNEGHIIHIDFGFLLSNSPGSVGFEAAPFKLTTEYVELLGGVEDPLYEKFVNLCKRCFNALRKDSEQIISIVELMQKDSNLPCFRNGENTSVLLKQRLQLHLTDEECDQFVEASLIGKSIGSMYTRLYDQFQMITQGIYS